MAKLRDGREVQAMIWTGTFSYFSYNYINDNIAMNDRMNVKLILLGIILILVALLLGTMDLSGYSDSAWAILAVLGTIFIVGLALFIIGLKMKGKAKQSE